MKTILLSIVLWLALSASHAEDRLWVNAKISGKPARLALDTGLGSEIGLFRSGADRLGLKLRRNGTYASLPLWQTGSCMVRLQGWSSWGFPYGIGHIWIVEIPSFVKTDADGCVGWPAIRYRVVEFDALKQTFKFLHEVPKATACWTKMALQPNSGILALKPESHNGDNEIILVDTGAGCGIALSPQKWREWETAPPNLPVTVRAEYGMAEGSTLRKQTWANKFNLSSMEMTDLLVEEDTWGGKPPAGVVATLGMAALKRLDFIVDGQHNVAYLRPKTTLASPELHNRLGATFVPRDPAGQDLIAHVAGGSPAADAGIRNGDVLLKVGERDVTRWRNDPDWAYFEQGQVGTKVELTVLRGGERLKFTAVLRDILAPNTVPSPSD